MEQELITEHQANLLMWVILIATPVIGLAWGSVKKQGWRGLSLGLLVGIGNFALWSIYNAVTDHLGLDTVRNLLVNLALFIFVGIAAGLGAVWYNVREHKRKV